MVFGIARAVMVTDVIKKQTATSYAQKKGHNARNNNRKNLKLIMSANCQIVELLIFSKSNTQNLFNLFKYFMLPSFTEMSFCQGRVLNPYRVKWK